MIAATFSCLRKHFALGFTLFLLAALSSQVSAETRGLQVVAKEVAGTDITIGKQYVVLIAIDRYAEWNSLRNPVKDAKSVKDILQRRYYVDEFVELYNEAATSSGIRKLFGSLTEKVGATDSVLIYFAGHGYLDNFKTGFWIPVDGGTDTDAQMGWIANSQIRNFITQMKARSVALVADSCFSGDLLNVSRGTTPTIDSAYYKAALKYTARQVLTSGASEAVPDESEFARQFRAVLESNSETCLDPLAMYDRIRRGVTETLPLLGTLPGHESGGSFVLFLKQVKAVQAPPPEAVPQATVTPPVVEARAVPPAKAANTLDDQIRLAQTQLVSFQTKYSTAQIQKQSKQSIGKVSFITGGISAVASVALSFFT